MKRLINVTCIISLAICFSGCAKEFLDIKPDKRQVVPQTVKDFQAMLDNINVCNLAAGCILNAIGSDEYTVTDDVWDLLTYPVQKNAYIWAKEVYEGLNSDDWDRNYNRVLYANTVIDGIYKISPTNEELDQWRNAAGTAFFLRALSFFQLTQQFCKHYNTATAAADPGIPLRLEPDISMATTRASVEESYRQIISDLRTAATLLPATQVIKFRPVRAAAYGLLAKTCLIMGNYTDARQWADSSLALSNQLINYNELDNTPRYIFSNQLYGEGNPEVLFMEIVPGTTITNSSRFQIDSSLYELYEDNDLRKSLFFFPTRNTYTPKGSYTGAYAFFSGIAVDEILLIRAECHARLNDNENALTDLNYLLKNRYDKNHFTPVSYPDAEATLKAVLTERRKQLLCRGGVRWQDLRRLSTDPRFQVTLRRNLHGQEYVLAPDDPRYTWPIPDNVIRVTGIQQNER